MTRNWTQGQHTSYNYHKVITAQLYGGSNSPLFINITIFTYIRPVKLNVHTINGSKVPTRGFGIFIIKIPKKHHYTTLSIILYATEPTKCNQSNCNKTLQSIQKCKN